MCRMCYRTPLAVFDIVLGIQMHWTRVAAARLGQLRQVFNSSPRMGPTQGGALVMRFVPPFLLQGFLSEFRSHYKLPLPLQSARKQKQQDLHT